MSRAEGGFENGEDGEGSPTKYFEYYWKKEIARLPIEAAVIEATPEMKQDKESARHADEPGDAARSRIVIKRRILGALPKDSQPTLGILEQVNTPQFGDPLEGQLADVIGDLMYDALHTWTRNPANQHKLKKISEDKAFEKYMLAHDEETMQDYLEGYIFDNVLNRLLYRV